MVDHMDVDEKLNMSLDDVIEKSAASRQQRASDMSMDVDTVSASPTKNKTTSGPECNCCGSTDHLKKDCPHTDKECGICGKIGHLKAKCNQGGPAAASKKRASSSGQECNCCGSADHLKKDCPHTDKECGICGKIGHLKAKCNQGGSAAGSKKMANNADGMVKCPGCAKMFSGNDAKVR
jgi:cellular nucleic acid-binding protein